MTLSDRNLPFSLSHNRGDQYCFSGHSSSSRRAVVGSSSVDPTSGDSANAADGFHRQVAFDTNCERIVSTPSTSVLGGTVNYRDTPELNSTFVLQSIQSSLQNNDIGYWAQLLSNHHIKVVTTCVDDFRTTFIKHLFSGECVVRSRKACSSVVQNDQSLEKISIQMIDAVLEWVDQGVMSLKQFSTICSALEITSNSSQKKRVLVQGILDRRRVLLDTLNRSLDDLVPCLGGRSSVKVMKSVGAAHGITFSKNDTRDLARSKLLNHVAQGKCVENIKGAGFSPACNRLVNESKIRNENSISLQVFILRRIIETALRKLLMNILELHEVLFEPDDSTKKLRRHLSKYVQSIERGKLKMIDDEYSATERLRKLDEIRENWPRMLPMHIKEQIVRDFRSTTSSAALASFTCACCARDSPLTDHI